MKLFKLFLFVCAFSFTMISCGDDGESPEIEIVSPADGATFSAGDTISFVLNLTDDIGVVSLNVENTELGVNGSETIIGTQPSIEFTQSLVLDSLTPAGEYEITFTANDADANSESESITINVE